jgi:hypothetical protein
MTDPAKPLNRPHHLAALLAVLAAARERLRPCSCGEPAIYTLGSPNVTLCKTHGRPHEGQHSLWEHPQTPLVAAIAAYDAIEEALPDLTEDETTDWRAKYEHLVAELESAGPELDANLGVLGRELYGVAATGEQRAAGNAGPVAEGEGK